MGEAMPLVRTAPPFIGRTDLLAALDACLADVLTGRPRLVLVRGVAGAGKTRLVNEFATRAQSRGVRVCHGRSHEDVRLPYLPFGEGLFGEFVAAAARGELMPLTADVATIQHTLDAGGPAPHDGTAHTHGEGDK